MESYLAKADLHLHSKASNQPGGWFSKLIGCPESYTEPKEIYNRLKERGMTFVTITDHNTIDGVLEIAHHNDVFVSCEYTVKFPNEELSVHILVYGIDENIHKDLLSLRDDVYNFVQYSRNKNLAYSLAHPLYSVKGSKITRKAIEKFVLLFDNWEVINGTRGDQVRYIEESVARMYDGWDKIHELENKYNMKSLRIRPFISFTAGSDDHGGMDVGRTWTAAPAKSVGEYLKALREGKTQVDTEDLGDERLINMISRVAYAHINTKYRLPRELKDILDYVFMYSNSLKGEAVLRYILSINGERYSMPKEVLKKLPFLSIQRLMDSPSTSTIGEVIISLMLQLLPLGITYMRYKEQSKVEEIAKSMHIKPSKDYKLAYVTDTYYEINGVARTARIVRQISQEYGLPVDVIIADKESYREGNLIALKSHLEFGLPFYPEFKVRVPSMLDLLELIQSGKYTHVHLSTPSALGLMALVVAKLLNLKVSFTFHTDVPSYAFVYTQSKDVEDVVWRAFGIICNACNKVFVPSMHYARTIMMNTNLDYSKVKIFKRGVDIETFNLSKKDPMFWNHLLGIKPDRKVVLYVGRVSKEKNLDLFLYLAKIFPEEAFVVVGDGPYRRELEQNKSRNVFFTGFLDIEKLAKAYASSYVFVFPSETDTYAQVVLEAMASGLPVIVSSKGAPHEHVEDGLNGYIANSKEEFAYKLAHMLENESLRDIMANEAVLYASSMDIKTTYLEYLSKIMDGMLNYETA